MSGFDDLSEEQWLAAAQAWSDSADVIQGFSYVPGFTAPHVIRNVRRPYGMQEIWRGDSAEEMRFRCTVERMRLAFRAAFSLSGEVTNA